ncbi:shikimate dehydrogenase [Leucobacter sp. CX42]|uniref:shikimate dehydrogenase family protein n=1 Tax=unclassified Leucobacter TaxID=2621730 RepID=UPI003340B494
MSNADKITAADAATEFLGVVGSPIAHSKSPDIHAAAYAELGLAWRYGRDELQAPDLAGYLSERLTNWRGLSLTMPLKEEAFRLASLRDPVAEESGVVNTLLRLDSEKQPWAGFNTDVPGLAAAVEHAGLDASDVLVLGSGATAVSAVLAARKLGAKTVRVLARNASAVESLVGRFDGTVEPGAAAPVRVVAAAAGESASGALSLTAATEADAGIADVSLVISTLPAGAAAELEVPANLAQVPLFDVAYDPWPSGLATAWTAAGGIAHPGVAMLVEQALLQVRIFVNGDPNFPVDGEDRVYAAMRQAGGLSATDVQNVER